MATTRSATRLGWPCVYPKERTVVLDLTASGDIYNLDGQAGFDEGIVGFEVVEIPNSPSKGSCSSATV